MQRINLAVNGKPYQVEAGADTPLFWGLRDTLGLSGTKLGCGMGLCGACTVTWMATLCAPPARRQSGAWAIGKSPPSRPIN